MKRMIYIGAKNLPKAKQFERRFSGQLPQENVEVLVEFDGKGRIGNVYTVNGYPLVYKGEEWVYAECLFVEPEIFHLTRELAYKQKWEDDHAKEIDVDEKVFNKNEKF